MVVHERRPAWACCAAICWLAAALAACDGSGSDPADGDDDDGSAAEPRCLAELARLDGPRDYVHNINWSPIDDLAAVGTDAELRLVAIDTEAQTLEPAAELADRATAAVTRWSADGRYLVTAGTELKLVEVERDPPALRQLAAFAGNQGPFHGMDWSADGRHVITGERSGAVRVFAVDVAAGTLTELDDFRGHAAAVYGVAWSPDRRHAASVGEDGTLRVLRIDHDAEPVTITEIASWQDVDLENAVRWARTDTGNPLLTGTWWRRHVIQVWDVDVAAGTLELQSEFVDHPSGINTMEWSRDLERIVTGGHDDTMRLAAFDGEALTTMAILEDHDSGVHAVSWSRDEAYMVMASSTVDRIALIDMRACPTAAELSD